VSKGGITVVELELYCGSLRGLGEPEIDVLPLLFQINQVLARMHHAKLLELHFDVVFLELGFLLRVDKQPLNVLQEKSHELVDSSRGEHERALTVDPFPGVLRFEAEFLVELEVSGKIGAYVDVGGLFLLLALFLGIV
jgi:hypothetical protein